MGLVHTQCRSPRDIWPLGVERGCDACDSVFGCKSYGLYRERDVLVRLVGYSYLFPCTIMYICSSLSPAGQTGCITISQLFSFFRTRKHIDNSTGVHQHHTKRSPERASSTTTSEPRGSFFLPSRASLLRWPLPRLIYTTLLVVPRASTRYSGPPPEGSGRVSFDTAPALHVEHDAEPRRPVYRLVRAKAP